MHTKKLTFVILFLSWVVTGWSQQSDLTTYHLYRSVPQANNLNPALFPDYKFTMSFPGLGSHFAYLNNNFLPGTLVTRNFDETTGTLTLSAEDFAERLKGVNRLEAGYTGNLFHFGFRGPVSFFSFGTNLRASAGISIPRPLFQVALQGNGALESPDLDIQKFSSSSLAYLENYFTYGRQMSVNLRVGARIKLLSGISHTGIRRIDGSAELNPDRFAFTINEMNVRSGGLAGILSQQLDGSVNQIVNGDGFDPLNDSTGIDASSLGGQLSNFGLGLDVGGTYRWNDFLFHAGINDLGFIRWSPANTYQLQFQDIEVAYEGVQVDAFELSQGGMGNNGPDVDSLINAYSPTVIQDEAYSTPLMARTYIGAYYDLADWHRVGLLTYHTFINRRWYPALNVAYNVKYRNIVDVAVTSTLVGGTFRNVGLGTSLNLGLFHVHMITDNILPVFGPGSVQNMNFRVGINFNFGKVKGSRSDIIPGASGDQSNEDVLEFLDEGEEEGGLWRK